MWHDRDQGAQPTTQVNVSWWLHLMQALLPAPHPMCPQELLDILCPNLASFILEGGLTTGQENFSLSQTCVSQCSQTLDSLGMFWKRKALNWKVARLVFPFSCTRMELSVAHLCCV